MDEDLVMFVDHEPGANSAPAKAIRELTESLRAKGRSVAVVNQWGFPRRAAGTTEIETILIFVGSGISTTLLNAIVADAYQSAKEWGRKRFGKKARIKDARVQRFIIQNQDGEILIEWSISGTGESEYDHRREFDLILIDAGQNKARVMMILRSHFRLDIQRAKFVVDNPPVRALKQADWKTVEDLKTALENVGATVEVRYHEAEREKASDYAPRQARHYDIQSDNGGFKHYVNRHALSDAISDQQPVRAFCDRMWIPQGPRTKHDSIDLPACQECKDVYDRIRPGDYQRRSSVNAW